MPYNIPFRIKQRRKELGLSQEALAKACGVGQSTVANWERGGHVPRQATLHKIAVALKTDEIWLLGGERTDIRGPLNSYLAQPIRHVTILNWPTNLSTFKSAQPIGYLPIASQEEDIFALMTTQDTHGFKAGTTLVFTRNSDEAGIFLDMSEDSCLLSDVHSSQSQARLIYSFTSH